MPFRPRLARLAWITLIAALLLPSSVAFAKKSRRTSSHRQRKQPVVRAKQPAPPAQAKARLEPLTYVAQPGDTLASIAEKFDTSLDAIFSLNRFPPDTEAQPGLVVNVPVGRKVVEESSWRAGGFDGPDGLGVVEEALRYQGVPYRRAGTSSRGLDCSGLVYRVLRSRGLSVPRTAATLFGIGIPVPKEELRAGDLVFFNTTSRRYVSHVGIYIADGKFVHASSSRGRVTIGSLTDGYYARRYIGARRVSRW